ncbi:MAG: radical SAM protein [Myxococcales bacterium]|nr:radical SAM protein [Myxococcales bacterium]
MTQPLPPRPRTSLPIAPTADPARRHLPLAEHARPVDKHFRPTIAVWEITLRCDLACRHCGSRAGRARPDELSTAEALDLIDQLAALGCREVTLIGGEAYLREDWVTLARHIKQHGIELTMTTGGRAMTADRAREVRDAGIESVSVSVDALEPMHDALRGVQGSWRAAIDAIANLRAAGVWVSANTQIARPALRDIEPLTDILFDAGCHSWQVSMTVPMGRAADEPSLILEPFQVLEVMPLIARVKKKATPRKIRIWPGNDIGYFGPYETLLRGTMPRGHMSACGAGRLTLGIEADGSIKGCPSLPTGAYVGGNVRDTPLREIWERAAALRFTRDRDGSDLWGYCGACYYGPECQGGCSWTAHVTLGRIGNNPFCHHRALEYLGQGLRERLRQVTQPEGKPFDHGVFETYLEAWPDDELAHARALAEHGEGFLLHTERAR